MPERKKRNRSDAKRLGFLLASAHTGVSPQVWPPLLDLAAKTGDDIFLFPGGRLSADDPTEAAKNRLFSLARGRNLDGAVSWSSSLGGFVGSEELVAFHEGLGSLPLVAMAHRIPGRPAVRIDAYTGMRTLIAHLIEVHGVKRIAFLRGPVEHESAEARLRAYSDELAAAGIADDPRLVASPRPWNDGARALEELLDGRGLLPGRDFDALAAASDLLLHAATGLLQARGFVVPDDLITAGFNDSIESRILSPMLTTVRMPFAEQARRAFEALRRLLDGSEEARDIVLPCELVVRRSCGCLSPSVVEAGRRVRREDRSRPFLPTAFSSVAARCGGAPEEREAWIAPLVDDFAAALESPEDDGSRFLRTLERIMERLIRLDRDLGPWQDALSALRTEALAVYATAAAEDIAAREKAEDLVGQGRVSVSEAVTRADAVRHWKAEGRAQTIRDLERDLIRIDERAALGPALAAHLGALGIAAAYLVEEDQGGAVLVAGYDEEGLLPSGRLGPFDPSLLLPPGLLPPPRGRGWIVEPLCAGDGYFGRLVARIGVPEGSVYEELRAALSSALQGLRSVDRIRAARAAAERAESLKSRFLSSVGGELRAPLKGIAEAVDEAAGALRGRTAPRIAESLAAIRTAVSRQLILTDDLLDLARCEAGELQLSFALVRPETLVAQARAAAEHGVSFVPADHPLPLLFGDAARLPRLLALLFDRAAPASLSLAVESGGLAFSVERTDGEDACAEDEGGLGRSVFFARRLASAHLGRLDQLRSADRLVGWRLRLPYPTLGGAVAEGSGSGRVSVVSGGDELPAPLGELFAAAGIDADLLPPAALKREAPGGAEGAALAWSPAAALSATEAAALRAASASPAWASRPVLLVPPPDAEIAFRSPAEFLEAAAGAESGGSAAVCDADEARGASLAAALSGPLLGDVAAVSPGALARSGAARFPALVVVRSGGAEELAETRRAAASARRRPVILVLLPPAAEPVRMDALEADPRALLLHEGVLSAGELAAFVRALVSGRDPLPPFTGAVVKRAQLYLRRRAAEDVSRWQVAEAVNVSEDYLTRVFKKELGLSPWEYLTRLRVAAARRLLREGVMSVREIGEAVGFGDQAYFCRVFKAMEGRTPSAYRGARDEG